MEFTLLSHPFRPQVLSPRLAAHGLGFLQQRAGFASADARLRRLGARGVDSACSSHSRTLHVWSTWEYFGLASFNTWQGDEAWNRGEFAENPSDRFGG